MTSADDLYSTFLLPHDAIAAINDGQPLRLIAIEASIATAAESKRQADNVVSIGLCFLLSAFC
eukprot:SAG31_NODE_472_length_15237_cov_3.424891_7_plen_63_part_00